MAANLALFLIYCTGSCLFDWLYVHHGQPHDEFLLWSAVPVTCAVNIALVQATSVARRVVLGLVFALLALGAAVLPLGLLLINFRLWIGGTL